MNNRVGDKKLLIVSSVVGLSWVAVSIVFKLLALGILVRLLIGIVPVALLIYQLLVIFRYVRGQDERHRRISLEALAIAFPTGLLGVFIIGFLMRSGVGLRLDFMDAGYFMIAGYIAGYLLTYGRYL